MDRVGFDRPLSDGRNRNICRWRELSAILQSYPSNRRNSSHTVSASLAGDSWLNDCGSFLRRHDQPQSDLHRCRGIHSHDYHQLHHVAAVPRTIWRGMIVVSDIYGPGFKAILLEAQADAIAGDPDHASDSITLLPEALTHSDILLKE